MKHTPILFFFLYLSSGLIAQTNQWTWVKGENNFPQFGYYGVKGTADPNNKPGNRHNSVSWTDASGNQWLFGGTGYSGSGSGYLNDLWKYSVVSNQWAWVSGENTPDIIGVYGIQGEPALGNQPGARQSSVSWTDANGNLWLFGGYGYGAERYHGYLNDLWKFNIASGLWTWVSGDSIPNMIASYGIRGITAPGNKPGARQSSVSWKDREGNLWLFGGTGYSPSGAGNLNDLWKYSISTGQWVWMSGKNTFGSFGTYGTKGLGAPLNEPSARQSAVSFTDSSGNLWLFGGNSGLPFSSGYLNDLWKYSPLNGVWTWINGDNNTNQSGNYGVKGVPSNSNKPGARQSPVSWTDLSGDFWLFGGYGYASTYEEGYSNDLWKYSALTNQWIWMGVDSLVNQTGNYGTKNITATTNKPGARQSPAGWADASGNLWLLGGTVYNTIGGTRDLNDLWKYSTSTAQWTWKSGEYTFGLYGIYGTKDIPDASNTPGARNSGASWSDASGNLWIMGGTGYAANDVGYLNDLWRFSVLTGQWTWLKGDNTTASLGYYGTKNVTSVNNQPPARSYTTRWRDKAGDLWLFGGSAFTSQSGGINDLWKYTIATNQWVWKSGDNISNQPGVYGVKGITSVNNKPGARQAAASWTDSSGNLWMFGGNVYIGRGYDLMNDLWRYSPSTGLWTWMSGDNTAESNGIYGVKGSPELNNKPGARYDAVTWSDSFGNLWMFGGYGYASEGSGNLSDLWKYTISTGQWTWVNGSKSAGAYSIYNTKGTSDATSRPGGRQAALGWTDGTGTMWLFGGNGYATNSPAGYLNDLWKYSVVTDQWTWVSGDTTIYHPGIYNTQGIADPTNTPGARYLSMGGSDLSGNLWLFGGAGYSLNGPGYMNDLWKFSATGAVLPVQYVSFKAEQKNKTVLLSWITAQEQNSKSFIIERSSGNVLYDSIGNVSAAGNSSLKSYYAFTDMYPLEGQNNYRLKQVDKDGRFMYSNVVKITKASTSSITVMQNPVKDKLQLQLELPVASKLKIQISDNSGHLIFTEDLNAIRGHSVILIPIRLNTGMYFINIRTKDENITKTFMK